MSCTFEEDLSAYVDGELPEERARAVKAHLESCADCRLLEALIRRTAQSMDSVPAFEPSPALRRRVLNAIEQQKPWYVKLLEGARPQLWVPAAGLAAALLVVVTLHNRHSNTVDVSDPQQLEVAMNLDELKDMDVAGLDSPDDVDVISELDELEKAPPTKGVTP